MWGPLSSVVVDCLDAGAAQPPTPSVGPPRPPSPPHPRGAGGSLDSKQERKRRHPPLPTDSLQGADGDQVGGPARRPPPTPRLSHLPIRILHPPAHATPASQMDARSRLEHAHPPADGRHRGADPAELGTPSERSPPLTHPPGRHVEDRRNMLGAPPPALKIQSLHTATIRAQPRITHKTHSPRPPPRRGAARDTSRTNKNP